MKEFCHIAKIDEEGIASRWTDATERLFEYARSEKRKCEKPVEHVPCRSRSINEGSQAVF